MSKRYFGYFAVVALVVAAGFAFGAPTITVYKDPDCGCCKGWVEHLRKNGFTTKVNDVRDMTPHKKRLGVPEQLAGCHTATVDGYTIEGHVPASEIKRLLRERPSAAGLAVPGMPEGSPGMETGRIDAYDVLLFERTGKTSVYRSYGK